MTDAAILRRVLCTLKIPSPSLATTGEKKLKTRDEEARNKTGKSCVIIEPNTCGKRSRNGGLYMV
jgi:hypothetical protein